MKKYLNIGRPINLLIIVLTMYMVRYFLIKPYFDLNQIELVRSGWQFAILVISVIFVAAYGYYINDITDVESDKINKKSRPLAEHPELMESATQISFTLLIIGLFLGLIAWVLAGNWMLIMIHLFAAASLYFYANHLQATALVGNFSAALLCATLPIIVLIFDLPGIIEEFYQSKDVYLLHSGEKTYNEKFYSLVLNHTLILSAFIFLVNLNREIIKDIEDITGDRQVGLRTLPIRYGVRLSAQISASVSILILFVFAWYLVNIIYPLFSTNQFLILSAIAFIAVFLPVVQSIYYTFANKFKSSSKTLKIAMLGALIFWLVFGMIY